MKKLFGECNYYILNNLGRGYSVNVCSLRGGRGGKGKVHTLSIHPKFIHATDG